MWTSLSRRASTAAAAALATLCVAAAEAAAQEQHDLVFPSGVACDFGLGVDIGPGGPRIEHEFTDANGRLVRVLSTGVGTQLTFTNLATGASTATSANGAVSNTVLHPDGSQTVTLTGHNILILFPADVPAGPSTTLYVGRVVFTVDAGGVTTLRSATGRATDICALLS